MNYSFEELEQALQIDLNNLDEARVNHVQLFYAVSKGYRTALNVRDSVKKIRQEVYGEQYFEAKALVEADHGKSTEALIKAQLDILLPCKDINDTLLKAEVSLNSWTALRDAYEQRSFALSSLIELYLAGYFGTVSAEVVSPKSKDNRANDRLEKLEQLEQLRRRKQKTE